MANLEENLGAGLEAVRFVKGKLRLGAKNKVGDLWRSNLASASCLDDLRADTGKYESRLQSLFKENQKAAIERLAEFTASAAAHYGCGNCNEQAALAFIYLRDRGVRPLDWVDKLNTFLSFGGHSFVVIGRESGKVSPKDWGPAAVICDPHGEETAYPVSDIEKYMPGARFNGKLRLDGRSDTSIRVRL